ncbi:MAG: diaminobutyrate--2-oxoglutarate transaminase [Stenomitos rutilans HA7619-LM2]|jgi:diaminobutyrate-2-oxoglutarate transaminase|nr:diaminobutyrate--2-oxoglutarate transaminase [Stenomitos rutilans HA7619-LM2]
MKEPLDYLNRQQERESNARSYPRRIPIAIKEAKGIYITDTNGKSYFDCLSAAGTMALGHNHPIVIEALQVALSSNLPWQTLDITTPIKDAFVEEIWQSLPAEFAHNAKIQFCGPSGADATEAAIKLVKTATGRRTMLSFDGAYHGMTNGALSLMGNLAPKHDVAALMPEVQFLPYPYLYRCPFGLGGEKGSWVSSHYIKSILGDPESGVGKPAGMILELVQGEGGVIPAPDEWVREIRRITQEHMIPLIVDEIQTGWGRTGKLFAFEHSDIIPDVLLLSKAIGGGLPLSVIVYHKSLDVWQAGAHAGTFRGNQLAMATGLASIRYIREQKLAAHAQTMGDRLLAHLQNIQTEHNCIGDVRGRGLMLGVEMVNPDKPCSGRGVYPNDPQIAREIQRACFDRGLILELGGRYGSVIRFLSPLIVTPEQIDSIAEIFHAAVKASA